MRIGTLNTETKKYILLGVLNVTPDSFSDGGSFLKPEKALDHAKKLLEAGVDIIDIGAESSRPGSDSVSCDEEQRRLLPIVEGIRSFSSIPLSIDTTKSKVAKKALECGANMINDISAGLHDQQMFEVVRQYEVPICLMHMRGTPKTMQENLNYEDVVREVFAFLQSRMQLAMEAGIKKENIMLDPGIGFGKSAEDDVRLLQNIESFLELSQNILIGTSKKKFMGKLLHLALEQREESTLATLSFAWKKGAKFLRVHDVEKAKRYLDMYCLLEGEG
ncbi:MAG: dihydropteroate synthase [Deltaproteobacteria bacterium CG_4_10_14_0_2_um_filter_43_8]|nr:MAG: dihydropteroate synthase [Deltaproteobacteria bacterium CG11_big_fil_rev_8_21_14_0_20_42_23]PJA20388.1 MAG: dihydropteroate synthase [Deltaproteobacteria bacterium CG_4_10_14_0_2_um_filter_43_8]PJC63787.1 MAG: dihydropteroate synthase [Deltaproteobacteria bacterium CG_4_9_14_0_2_um_filter_42_21]